MNKYALLVGNILGLVLVLVVNYLANALPLNGVSTGEISDRFDVLFKPAGYAFAIWGFIYLGLIAWVIYSALKTGSAAADLSRIGFWFLFSCLANALWLLLWHHSRFTLTVLVMFLLLGSLIMIYLKLGIGNEVVPAARRWLVHHPFSLYLGWISVATIANVTIWLDSLGWKGFGLPPAFWFAMVLAVAVLLSLFMALIRHDLIFNLVVLWALVAVGVNTRTHGRGTVIAWTAGALALIPVAVSLIYRIRAGFSPDH